MRDIVVEASAAVLAGKYNAKDLAAVGQRVYSLSGKDASTDSSFKAQASKIAKCLKLAVRWNGAGLSVLEQAFDLKGNSYNDTLLFVSRINTETKDKAAAPSSADLTKWHNSQPPKAEREENKADIGDKILKLLQGLVEIDPAGKGLKQALTAMGQYMETAGMTTAQLRVAKDTGARKASIADTLAKIAAATAKGNGAQVN
jgi:hypothetical protein